MFITHRYLHTLEQAATAKHRQQLIINQCQQLEQTLQQAIQASEQRLKLFQKEDH